MGGSLDMTKRIVAIDFFCGAGGLTRGLLDVGIDVVAGIDNDERLRKTYEHNNHPSKFVCKNVEDINIRSLVKELGIERHSSSLLYVACTPCQPFSTLNRSNKLDERQNLLLSFGEIVLSYPPDFIIVENVPGINGKKNKILEAFLSQLKKADLKHVERKPINALDYGVPQKRKRYILLASRRKQINFPHPIKSSPRTVRDAISHLPDPDSRGSKIRSVLNHQYRPLRENHLKIVKAIPKNGGSRRDVKDDSVLLKCHRGKPRVHRDVFGRMSWDKPSPTLTTRCTDIYCGRFTHPTADRGITLREAATIQTFKDDYEFFGKFNHCALQIGNAVPVKLSRHLGKSVIRADRSA